MFTNKDEAEADFCAAYKSEILNNNAKSQGNLGSSFLKILTIILLVAIIVAGSIYAYIYITEKDDMPDIPQSIQIMDNEQEDLIIPLEVEDENESEKNDGIEQIDIDEIAKDVKKAITTDVNEKNVTMPPIVETENEPTQPTEFEEDDGGYLEELADLSKAIEKENSNKK